jgi:hypothetical protein
LLRKRYIAESAPNRRFSPNVGKGLSVSWTSP